MASETLADRRSSHQHIRLFRDPAHGLVLTLDGAVQFCSIDEHVYHEGLVVVPMLYGGARAVFIGGGGDGLAAARALAFPEVERLTLCELDEAVTALAREQPELTALNGDALADPRVRLVHADARGYLAGTDERYDLVVLDFPCPHVADLERLFTREMYALVRRRLSPGGRLAIQALATSSVLSLGRDTLASVFPWVSPYRLHRPDGSEIGFLMASDAPAAPSLRAPGWTRHVDDAVAVGCRAFGKDELAPPGPPSTDASPRFAWRWTLEERGVELSRCPYAPDHALLNLGPATTDTAPLVRAAVGLGPTVIWLPKERRDEVAPALEAAGYRRRRTDAAMAYPLTPRTRDVLVDTWRRLDDRSVTHLDAITGRTVDHLDLRTLFDRYLSDHADRFLDVPPARHPGEAVALHLVARTPAGDPVALMMVRPRSWMVDVLYGVGSSRQNMLGLLLQLRYLHRRVPRCADALAFSAATPNVAKLMTRLGAEFLYDQDVWAPHPSRAPDLP